MTDLTDIYDVITNKRGKAKEGLIRPTISQFFTSKDFCGVSTDTSNGVNHTFSDLMGYLPLRPWVATCYDQIVEVLETPVYSIPRYYEYKRLSFADSPSNGGLIVTNDGYTVQGTAGWIIIYSSDVYVEGMQQYTEFRLPGLTNWPNSVTASYGIHSVEGEGNWYDDYYGRVYHNDDAVWGGGPHWGKNSVIGMAIDTKYGHITFRHNGIWFNTVGTVPVFEY